jgi:hypothetical protein
VSVWKPANEGPRELIFSDRVELFRAPTGRMWYRERSAQEVAELRVLHAEHHPTEERLNRADPTVPGDA